MTDFERKMATTTTRLHVTKKTIILVGFILLKFWLQYHLISPVYELHRDEYLYLDQGHHLAWGYISVPPFTAWISKLIILLGNGVFWVKFFPALFGALTIVVVWKAIETLKGNLFALVLGATCVLLSALLRLNTLYQPNSLDVLSWAMFYFVAIKYFKTEQPKWLFIGALVFAIGFLNKYNIAFLIIPLIPAILLTGHRKVFARKQLYTAMLLGLILILPNLLWQYNNDFPFIYHLTRLKVTQLVNVDKFGFLKAQFLFFTGSLLVIFSALYALLFYKPFKIYRAFFWAFFFTLIVFMYFRAKDYYAIGLYPIYIVFGSVFLANVLNKGWKRFLQPVVLAIPVLIMIPFSKIAFPNRNPDYVIAHSELYKTYGLLRWEDGRDHQLPQDFSDMLGWKELARKVDSVYLTLPNAEQTLILCDNYGQTGAINYYTKQGLKAVSFNADYVNWFNLDIRYTNLIRVKEREEHGKELKTTAPYFNTAVVADSITNPYAREHGTTIFAFTGAKVDVNKRISAEIEKAKRHD